MSGSDLQEVERGALSLAWRKLGLIFAPDKSLPWSRSHASLPTPLMLEGSGYRIFYAARDGENRSHVGSFDIDLEKGPGGILDVPDEPVLRPGPLGHFDDHGVYASSAVRFGDRVYLYTIGWNPGPRPPLFYASIGLATSEDGGRTFSKMGLAPIMGRSDHDPCLVTSPMVLRDRGKWRMWYVSGHRWDETDGGPRSCYHIKYAESDDCATWRRDGLVAIDHASATERNISRACVITAGGRYHAWYGYDRGEGYRIGYAVSADGLEWTRLDDRAGIDVSPSGWDSEAIAYPAVVKWRDRYFMFYNGNGFGRDGIGLAVADAKP